MEILAERVRTGRLPALEEVYDAYGSALYQYALSMLWNRQDAEDALQNVFVKLLRMARQGGMEVRDLKGYLFRAVRNEAITIRSRGRLGKEAERSASQVGVMEAASGADPLEAARIQEVLADLPMEQREVLVLKVYHDMTFAEIAELTVEKLNTVASRYKYAVAKLQRRLRFQEERR